MLERHAFAEGNRPHIDLLKDARRSILETLASIEYQYGLNVKRAYTQFKSDECYPGQAADVAAGIATHILEERGLVGVVSQFEYITYNGARISLKDAEEQMRRGR